MANATSIESAPPGVTAGEAAPSAARTEVNAWALRILLGAQVLVGLALFGWFAPQLHGDLWILALLITLNVIAAIKPIAIYGDSYIDVSYALSMAIIVLFGPAGVVIAAPIEAIAGGVARRGMYYRVVTNAALFMIVYCAGAAAYSLVIHGDPEKVHWATIPAVALAAMVSFATNAGLLTLTIRLHSGQRLADIWEKHRWLAPHYVALGLVGFALASAYVALGVTGIIAFLMPALMMRFATKQYVDKTEENVTKLQTQNTALVQANGEIRRVSDELRNSYDGTLEALVNALDARDQETKGHSIRVSRYMMKIAKEMGVPEGTQEWTDMQRGSLLHDVGKIGVSDTILLKPGKLTDDEWQLMRLHPEIGFNMLRQVRFLQGAAELILQHHERWDGKGYPRGLHEEEIDLGPRIFSVVDTFDSMTSDRPYRKAMSTQEAMNEILRCSATQFDPQVVEAFLDTYEQWVKDRDNLMGTADSPISLASAA